MEKNEIKVCNCGAPLHWTYLYNGQECFCMNCQAGYGMLGAGENVALTLERKARQKVADGVFKAIRKHLFGSGTFYRYGCKKCDKAEYHPLHTTKYEKARNEEAEKILNALKGYFELENK